MKHQRLLVEINQATLSLTQVIREENEFLKQQSCKALSPLAQKKFYLSQRYMRCLHALKQSGLPLKLLSKELLYQHENLNQAMRDNEMILTSKMVAAKHHFEAIMSAVAEAKDDSLRTYSLHQRVTKKPKSVIPLAVNETF